MSRLNKKIQPQFYIIHLILRPVNLFDISYLQHKISFFIFMHSSLKQVILLHSFSQHTSVCNYSVLDYLNCAILFLTLV